MSGFGGFGGFSQNGSTQQNSTAFGGFGANANTNSGFGTATNTGFGSNVNSSGAGAFGSTSGFGSASNNTFGASKPSGFGLTPPTGGGLFGSNNTTTNSTFGSGGFGSTATPSTFGTNNTGGGLFGATSSPFGNTAVTTNAFGAPTQNAISQAATGDCQGTASVSFQPFVEKEPNSSNNQQNTFQNICFQLPYQKFSMEELRLADYNQGRRFGNGSNQPGAFGQTNYGGFGSGTTGFGSTNNTIGGTMFGSGATSSPFGTTQTATTGFGTNTSANGTGLFGAKPSTGTLFGSQTLSQPSSGLFGNSNTGFGASNTSSFNATNTNSGASLFGQNATSKPPFSFGSATTNSTGTGFGTPASTGGFGSGGLFGNNNQQQSTTTGFGAQQTAPTNTFGGFGANNQQTGTPSLFGNTQPKATGGLFGTPATTTNTGLFGNTQVASNTNLFGATNTNQSSGGLFGNKPAGTGTDNLFGNTVNTQPNTNGNLFGSFGNQTQNQQPSGGLFGGLSNNNNQQKSSIFGNNQPAGGGSLFGNSGSQQQSSLFGGFGNNSQQQQQAPNSLFGNSSISFNASTQNQQAPQSLTASISDNTAFGSQSLFSNIAATQVNNPGPIATPLSGNRSSTSSKSAALPIYKLNSASVSRLSTPQKRGFGLSYGPFGSPGSANSTASTPGTFSGSNILGSGSFSRTLSKSMSTSSLRQSFNVEDSILAPGAFSAGSSSRHLGGPASVKKLTINRNIRSDLFNPPTPQSQANPSTPSSGILKKRVSFDANVNGNGNGTVASSPLKQVNTKTLSSTELGYLRPSSDTTCNLASEDSPPETEQTPNINNQLAIVREEESLGSGGNFIHDTPDDKKQGEYWMSPSKSELESMNRVQRQRISGLTVGRYGVGSVQFDVPVDLTSINLEDIPDNIVKIGIRQVTVYPDNHKKPPMGKGLNVPSTITLENSWPRKKDRKSPLMDQSGARLQKHIDKLKKVEDTEFISYDKSTGTWVFKVPHFTTYGLPEDEDDDEMVDQEHYQLSDVSRLHGRTEKTPQPQILKQSLTESGSGDTDCIKKPKKSLPGRFDPHDFYDEDEEADQESVPEPYSDNQSMASGSENGIEEPKEPEGAFNNENISIVDQNIVGTYPEAGRNMQLIKAHEFDDNVVSGTEDSSDLTRLTQLNVLESYLTPPKSRFLPGDDWVTALQATISPKKHDRALLKALVQDEDEESESEKFEPTPTKNLKLTDGSGFATSIDLMNSLFGKTGIPSKSFKSSNKRIGSQLPFEKRPDNNNYNSSYLDQNDFSFHQCLKPGWGPDGTLVYAAPLPGNASKKSSKNIRTKNDLLVALKREMVSEHRDIHFAKFSNEASVDLLKKYKEMTVIKNLDGVPSVALSNKVLFSDLIDDNVPPHEKLVWKLASILWDPVVVPDELRETPHVISRLQKDSLSSFWEMIVSDASTRQVALAKNPEEKAIACLSGHRIDDACANLVGVGDYRLSILVALIGSKDSIKKDMKEQLDSWRKSKILPEITQPIRAIYEILAGNVCVCEEVKGPPEDKVESFTISKRFGLDWRQAFGLRLWYGISSNEYIEAAVEDFAKDLAEGKEESRPCPWYVEQKVPILWQDPYIDEREDLLWGIMKLYTFGDADLEDILRPENSQLSPMDMRLSWQLSQVIISSGSVKFKGDNDDKSDRTTLSFASQLTNEGNWLDTIFVLLHLTSANARVKAIQDQLGHHGGDIGTEDSQNFLTLTKVFKIPPAWVWEAKALFVRSVEKNPRGEVESLMKAGLFNEAHQTFSRTVAPQNIVELDYVTLRMLLKGFSGKEAMVGDWHLGGSLYQAYLELLESEDQNGKYSVDDSTLERLLYELPSMVEESRHPQFIERASVEIMSAKVAEVVQSRTRQGMKISLAQILNLPLSEDNYLKYAVELGSIYYRSLMNNLDERI